MCKPKVSIIIPVYNGENYMREAIDSALVQTYENCEVIVVNDGSTDSTEQIALSYGNKIRYFAKKNGGVSSALNLGIKNMAGEYFSWLSHDDIYYPQKVEASIQALQKAQNMHALLYGAYDIKVCGSELYNPSYHVEEYSETQLEDGTFAVLQNIINGCTVLIHRKSFDEKGYFDEELRTTQDYDMWFRLFRGEKVIYIKEPLIISRKHPEQDSKRVVAHLSNAQSLHLWMLKQLEQEEKTRMYDNEYHFWYERMEFFERNGFGEAVTYAQNELKQLEIPKDYIKGWNMIRDKLQIKKEQAVNLFGAGKNARMLIRRLCRRGIEIDYLSDNDEKKWDTRIEDVLCVAKENLDKVAPIIVTINNPEKLKKELMEYGFVNVYTYDDIKRELLYSYGTIE